MNTPKQMNSDDKMRSMLNTMRRLNSSQYGRLREQVETHPQQGQQPQGDNSLQQGQGNNESKNFIVINNVEVDMYSTDSMDLTLNDTDKAKISQLIDDFRVEVSELTDFGKLIFYQDSAKLDGVIPDVGIKFTLSTGDDEGVFISNAQMLKLSDQTSDIINKLKLFSSKFSDVINSIISLRKSN